MEVKWRELAQRALEEVPHPPGQAADRAADAERALDMVRGQANRWLSPPAVACLSRFLEGEMDWETEGARGYGRVTEAIPRLGGWQRGAFSRLDTDSASKVRDNIAECLLHGYALTLLMEPMVRRQVYPPQDVSEDELWRRWIPMLYGGFGSEEPLSSFKSFVAHLSGEYSRRFRTALSNVGIRIGVRAAPRLCAIVKGYVESGILLRQLEIWGKF